MTNVNLIQSEPIVESKLPEAWTLVQRCSVREAKGEGRKGVDKILAFDYMGAAEFEFGALGKSFTLMRAQAIQKDLTVHNVLIKGQGKVIKCYVLASPTVDMVELLSRMSILADPEARGQKSFYCKECTWFDEWFKPAGPSAYRTSIVAWLVLDKSFPILWTLKSKIAQALLTELSTPKTVQTVS